MLMFYLDSTDGSGMPLTPSVLALQHSITIPLHTIRLLWRKCFYGSFWCLAHDSNDLSHIAMVDVGMSRIAGSINSKSSCGGVLLYFYHSLRDAIRTLLA